MEESIVYYCFVGSGAWCLRGKGEGEGKGKMKVKKKVFCGWGFGVWSNWNFGSWCF